MQLTDYLRKIGARVTPARRSILGAIAESSKPISADEIGVKLIKDGFEVNKTTIYRELEFLKTENLIREIDFLDGRKRYEATSYGHHHHVICKACGGVEELGSIPEYFINTFSRKSQFLIQDHNLEFFGLCQSCQKEV
ncbi:MAG: Fur family transcriptional regulator [Candidatus Woykebacteria bacterium]